MWVAFCVNLSLVGSWLLMTGSNPPSSVGHCFWYRPCPKTIVSSTAQTLSMGLSSIFLASWRDGWRWQPWSGYLWAERIRHCSRARRCSPWPSWKALSQLSGSFPALKRLCASWCPACRTLLLICLLLITNHPYPQLPLFYYFQAIFQI